MSKFDAAALANPAHLAKFAAGATLAPAAARSEIGLLLAELPRSTKLAVILNALDAPAPEGTEPETVAAGAAALARSLADVIRGRAKGGTRPAPAPAAPKTREELVAAVEAATAALAAFDAAAAAPAVEQTPEGPVTVAQTDDGPVLTPVADEDPEAAEFAAIAAKAEERKAKRAAAARARRAAKKAAAAGA